MAAFFAVFPNLLYGALDLIDLVDDSARILHFRKRRLFHAAGVAVVEDRNPNHVLVGLGINTPSRVLRPRPVECVAALSIAALQGLALGIDRREQRFLPGRTPAARRPENPLHLLVAADLDDRGLVTRGNDDRIIGRVVVNGIDVRPVAAWAGAGKVAEVGRGFLLGEVFCRERMTGLARIDVQADSTLVERLDDVAAVRIENIKETPFIDHTAFARSVRTRF